MPATILGHEGGWIGGSYIDGRREQVPARILGPKGKWIVRRLSSEEGGYEAMCQQGFLASKGGWIGGAISIGEGNKC